MQQQVFFARIRKKITPGFLPFVLNAGDELPVNTPETLIRPGTVYCLMKRDLIGIYQFDVPRDNCTIFSRVQMSRFVPGDIVKKRGTECVFRIYSVKWDRVDFWYQDGFGESGGFASGAFESDLELATEFDIERAQHSLAYYDELMFRRSNLFPPDEKK